MKQKEKDISDQLVFEWLRGSMFAKIGSHDLSKFRAKFE